MEKVLITGITGQDGIFLSKNILKSNPDVKVYGVTRKADNQEFKRNLLKVGTKNTDNIKIYNFNLLNKLHVRQFIQSVQPTIIYNLSGPSSVGESIIYPKKTHDEITMIFENLVSALIDEKIFIPFFQASSSEMYGTNKEEILTEDSEFNPQSPYAKAKLVNHNKVINLSREFNIKSGIMFNHESEFRKSEYLFKKVINGAKHISQKKLNSLKVGSLTYERDWTFAGDVSKAMIKIIHSGSKNSYIIGSGKSHSIQYFISLVFDHFNLDWEKYVEVDPSLLRVGDPEKITCDPSRLIKELNWKPEYTFENLVERCVLNSMDN
jgi:GDPmannose 4,6-dehydratase